MSDNFFTIKFIKKKDKIILLENKIINTETDISETIDSERIDIENIDNLDDDFLYPSLNDKFFNKKISNKKEFYDNRYDTKIYDVTKYGDILCNQSFELSPHQQFVKNFLSTQTPYNSLLLYHGVGTGKTCSAIGVAEEMRDYLKQIGENKKIVVIANSNVQDEIFKQLFDKNKLKFINNEWNIKSCVGNSLLKEINPINLKQLSYEKVVSEINNIIKNNYSFFGYTKFGNELEKITNLNKKNIKNKDEIIKKILENEYNNTLLIIDEVHNIRLTEDSKNKKLIDQLFLLIKNVKSLKLLLLSATPLYNNYKEIILLINLMNYNDKKDMINVNDVFDNNGDFIKDEEGNEIGKELLIKKATGYISHVKGDNPYTFPYRVASNEFNKLKTLDPVNYPKYQLNGVNIIDPIKNIPIYVSNIGEIQKKGYQYILSREKKRDEFNSALKKENYSDKLGYKELQNPIQSLNMVYPNEILDLETNGDIKKIIVTGV